MTACKITKSKDYWILIIVILICLMHSSRGNKMCVSILMVIHSKKKIDEKHIRIDVQNWCHTTKQMIMRMQAYVLFHVMVARTVCRTEYFTRIADPKWSKKILKHNVKCFFLLTILICLSSFIDHFKSDVWILQYVCFHVVKFISFQHFIGAVNLDWLPVILLETFKNIIFGCFFLSLFLESLYRRNVFYWSALLYVTVCW